MAKLRLAQVVACVMAVIVPASMAAADMNSAMVHTSGPVLVNGAGVSRTAAIFAGDKLQVPLQSAAMITAKGSSVTVAPGSTVTFRGDAIALERGSAVFISTTGGIAAQVGNLTVAPAGKSETKFQVARLNGNIVISAKLGAVDITDNEGTSKRKAEAVPEGKTATVPDAAPQAPPAGAASAGLSHANAVGIVAGLAAVGVAAGVAIATTGTPAPVSPAGP